MPSTKAHAIDVYKELKHLLVNYRFRPGVQLYPSGLADRFRVSTTPVREALYRLTGEQLLDSVPNRGFFSRVLALKEMSDLSVLSNVLLKHAIGTYSGAGLPANSVAPVSDTLERIATDLDRADDCLSLIEHVFEEIASISGNQVLVKMIENINDRTHYVSLLDLQDNSRREEIRRGVTDLIAHLRAHDSPGASDNLDQQLRQKIAVMPRLVNEGLVRSLAAPAPLSALGGDIITEEALCM